MKKIIFLILLIPLLLKAQPSQIKTSSTSVLLGSAATWTGAVEEVQGDYNWLVITVKSNVGSAANGLRVSWTKTSYGVVSWVANDFRTYTANDTTTNRYWFPVVGGYFRVSYTNNTTAQTSFSLTSVLVKGANLPVDSNGNIKVTLSQAQLDSLQKITEFPGAKTYADIRNSWDWARSFTDYRDTVKVNSVAVDTILVGGTEWAKVTVRGTSASDSLYVGFGTTAPTVWHKVIGTTPFVTEKLNHTYFTKIFLKGYGANNSIKSYEITIEAF